MYVTIKVVFNLLHGDMLEEFEHQDEAVVGHLRLLGDVILETIDVEGLSSCEVEDRLPVEGKELV